MTEKRYVFIPEPTKIINVYNTNNPTLKNYANFSNLTADVTFSYSIDEFDKIKLFYINGKSEYGSTDDFAYLNNKAKDSIKSLFNINDINEFKLILEEENPRIEFTLFYNIHGLPCNNSKLEDYNKNYTLLAHTYTYNIYKRYNLH